MFKKAIFVTVGTAFLVLGYQNCGSGNKDMFDLKLASQKTSSSTNPTYIGPVTLTLANAPGGNTIDQFLTGSSIFVTVSNAGPGAKICGVSSTTCSLSGNITSWTDLNSDGWNYSGGNWTKTYDLNGSPFAVGSHRIYFVRPNPSNGSFADTNGFASADFTVKN